VALLCRKNKNTAMQQLFYVEKANIHSCFVDNGLREPCELIAVQGVDYVSGLLIEKQPI
jgi:hypothetical protein